MQKPEVVFDNNVIRHLLDNPKYWDQIYDVYIREIRKEEYSPYPLISVFCEYYGLQSLIKLTNANGNDIQLPFNIKIESDVEKHKLEFNKFINNLIEKKEQKFYELILQNKSFIKEKIDKRYEYENKESFNHEFKLKYIQSFVDLIYTQKS